MIDKNGYSRRPSKGLIIAFIDGLLIMLGVFIGGIFRYGGFENNFFQTEHLEWKIVLVVFAFQTVFYYFDLYEMRNFRIRIKVIILVVEAMAVSCLSLAVIYYAIPFLAIGKEILAISILNILIMLLVWRFIYFRITKIRIFKERVLIIGTGEMAQKIIREVSENGQDAFEIVGFVAEKK